MEAQVYLIVNSDELNRNENLGLPEIEPEEKLFKFYFELNSITAAYMFSVDRIVIYILGDPFAIKYDAALFKKIKEHLNK